MSIISKILTYLKKRHKLVKDIIVLGLVIALGVSIAVNVHFHKQYKEESSVTHSTILDKEALKNQNVKLNLEVQEQYAQILSLQEQIKDLERDVQNKQLHINGLETDLANNIRYPDKEYVQSTYVWNYLKETIGLNDYVAAGIMGNIMTEVGGQTLDISKYSCRESNGGAYYGMCQWAGPRKERLLNDFGGSLEAQCKFLNVELFEIIPEDNSFYDLQDEQEAALYFAKKYERCATWSYAKRQSSATKALQYFTGTEE